MRQHIALIAVVVESYNDAIAFYTEKLGFELIEDSPLDDAKRWVVVAPKGGGSCNILLAKAVGAKQRESIGNQTGGRVFLFLYTDDFWRDYKSMLNKGVCFVREPKKEIYGMVTVFEDLYGNLWDLLEPAQ